MDKIKLKHQHKRKKALRVRRKLRGTAERPRLCIVKSSRHIQAQIIDDEQGLTLCGIATYSKELKTTEFNKKSVEAGKHIGTTLAEQAKSKGVEKVVLDRGPFKYHGIIAAVADGMREAGIQL